MKTKTSRINKARIASGKAVLAGLLLAGFFISIPFWLQSSDEQRQQLSQSNTAAQLLEQQIGVRSTPSAISQVDEQQLRKMLKPDRHLGDKPVSFQQQVWEEDIAQLIRPWIKNKTEALQIARWVYLYSQHFKLKPELILAVITIESQFDHFAISSVGARGLMQVMPFWKKELGSSDDNLFSAETNIRYGCAIIRHYVNRYKRIDRALAAYNGSLGKQKYPNKVLKQMRRFEGKLQRQQQSHTHQASTP